MNRGEISAVILYIERYLSVEGLYLEYDLRHGLGLDDDSMSKLTSFVIEEMLSEVVVDYDVSKISTAMDIAGAVEFAINEVNKRNKERREKKLISSEYKIKSVCLGHFGIRDALVEEMGDEQ